AQGNQVTVSYDPAITVQPRETLSWCGGSRFSQDFRRPRREDDLSELLQWLERRHLLHGLVTDSNPVLGPGLQPLPQTSHHHRHHRAAATNPARYCCLSGCTQQDLLTLCPY
uniref:Insulin like 3 n=1 Tax=Mandrillus leucophaeus TaxID=9568 RepID=A0A2K6A6M8_MANLE